MLDAVAPVGSTCEQLELDPGVQNPPLVVAKCPCARCLVPTGWSWVDLAQAAAPEG